MSAQVLVLIRRVALRFRAASKSSVMLLVAFFLTGRLDADIVILKGKDGKESGRVEGELLNPSEKPRTNYRIRTAEGAEVVLAPDQVKRVILRSNVEREYDEKLPSVPPNATGNWEMAQWCGERGLKAQREFHLEQVLKHDAEHEEARRALGFRKLDGKWQRPDEYWSARGYVRHKGSWRLAQEVEAEKAKDQIAQREKDWRKKIRAWRKEISKGGSKRAEALTNLSRLSDPLAAPALADLLNSDKEPAEFKLLYIEPLGRLKHGAGTAAFIDRAVKDDNERVRSESLDQLLEFGTEVAVKSFVKALESPDNGMVNRAAAALRWLRDPSATRPLIDALVTKHRFEHDPGGNAQATFSDQGGGAFQFGGRQVLVEKKLRNPEALNALNALTNVNFQYDQDAWRKWFAEQVTPPYVSLRRDE